MARETQAGSSWDHPSLPHAATCRRPPHPPLVRSAVLQESMEGMMAEMETMTVPAAATALAWMVLVPRLRISLGTRRLSWLAQQCCCFLVPMA